jgi:hypothetical protein
VQGGEGELHLGLHADGPRNPQVRRRLDSSRAVLSTPGRRGRSAPGSPPHEQPQAARPALALAAPAAEHLLAASPRGVLAIYLEPTLHRDRPPRSDSRPEPRGGARSHYGSRLGLRLWTSQMRARFGGAMVAASHVYCRHFQVRHDAQLVSWTSRNSLRRWKSTRKQPNASSAAPMRKAPTPDGKVLPPCVLVNELVGLREFA